MQLADSPGPRILGMRVRDRNERVIARSGASLVGPTDTQAEQRTLIVPDDIVLEPSLFRVLREIEPPCRLRNPDGAELAWGSALVDTPLHSLKEHDFLDVASASKRRRAERILILRTGKSTDGWVSRRFNRPQSRFFSRWFLKAGLSANAASAISLALGLGCALAAARPGAVWLAVTGVLFQFASMFDGVDGEMARVTYGDSKIGAAIDAAVDNLTYLATLVGFGVGWAREGISEVESGSLAIVSLLLVLTLFQVFLFVRRYAPNASFVFFDRALQRATRDTRSLSLRGIDVFFRATRRDLLALILMFVSFWGSRFAILCLVGLGVLVTDYLLMFHRRDLARAAAILRSEDGTAWLRPPRVSAPSE